MTAGPDISAGAGRARVGAGPEPTAPAAHTVKPRLRGFIHLWALLGALAPGTSLITLAAVAVSGVAAAATTIYVATLLALLAASSAYHRRRWGSDLARKRMGLIDQAMIFIFIAGTYTPLIALAAPRGPGLALLVVVWLGAGAGAAVTLLWRQAPRWVAVVLCLALGWVAVLLIPHVLTHGGAVAVALLITGGVFYTAGAGVYATRRPRGWPATFGFHEFFHAATVIAVTCQHIAIWLVLFA
jgi:hemolysin III